VTDSIPQEPEFAGNLDETNDLLDPSAPEIVSLLDEYLEQLKRGEAPKREDFLAKHPEHADQLQACLASLDFLSKERDDLLGKKQIGDFRILSEIGQGGMGTVYEAEQISLGRKVALKIVRAGRQSKEAIERFQREAETVAGLHHTNIVPIFSVGADEEINYFAMQLIDGKSLSQVSREAEEPIESKQAAEWGLGIVEALAHAHERGVVHRDVKPSNVLLDREDNVWLSDFGLAKRSDDLTLSVTGAILGTPRYMSPEQARGSMDEVDHRSDIYSVGATLYELVTKSPVFDAESPHKIITKIINDEPKAPRSLDETIPKDLETILLKSLQKHPARRYQIADHLADDLRAFLDDRPISARPESVIEKGSRWLRKKRSTLSNFLLASVATIAIALFGFAFESWRQLQGTAEYLFAADVPGAVAEIFDENDERILEPLSLPTPEPLTLRRGDYKVRVSAPGRFSVTKPVTVKPDIVIGYNGREPTFNFHLNSRLVGPPINVDHAYGILPGQGRILSFGDLGITCLDYRSGKAVWISPITSWTELTSTISDFKWEWQYEKFSTELDEPNVRAPHVVTGVGDLDGDGTHDFLLAANRKDWVLAFSAASGKPLWAHSPGMVQGQEHAGPPLVIPDVDGDGARDIVIVTEEPFMARALSGKTGEVVWNGDIDIGEEYDAYHSPPADGSPPAKSVMLKDGKRTVHPHPAQLVTIDKEEFILAIAGKFLRCLDLNSGEAIHTCELPVRSSHKPIVEDVDGDGSSDLVVTDANKKSGGKSEIVVWSIKHNKTIFEPVQFEDRSPSQRKRNSHAQLPEWPQLADLDQDGQMEMIHRSLNEHSAIEATDHYGTILWTARIESASDLDHFLVGPDIDNDGYRDVFVASLWSYQHQYYNSGRSTLFVDAISGSDGRKLWASSSDVQAPTAPQSKFRIHKFTKWEQTESAWPSLVVSVHPDRDMIEIDDSTGKPTVRPVTFCFSSADGELLHRANQIGHADVVDADGDGIDDLVAYRAETFRDNEVHNLKVSVLMGQGHQLWESSQGYPLPTPTSDLNGDDVGDLVQLQQQKGIQAISGVDGKVIWTAEKPHWSMRTQEVFCPPSTAGFDPDQDGVQDLLWIVYPLSGRGNQPFASAVSGASGRQLWESSTNVTDAYKLSLIEFKDLDQDGVQEIILVGSLKVGPEKTLRRQNLMYSTPWPPEMPGLTMLVIDQRTGSLKWKQQISESNQPYLKPEMLTSFDVALRRPNELFEFDIDFADLDGDGTLDVIAPVEPMSQGFELHAISGANGELLGLSVPLYKVESLHDLPQMNVCEDENGSDKIIVVAADPESPDVIVTALGSGAERRWRRTFPVHNWVRGTSKKREKRHITRAKLLRTHTSPYFAINLKGVKSFAHNTIVVLDSKGKTFGKPLQLNNSNRQTHFECWPVDVDGDQVDELAVVDRGTLKIFSVEEGFPLVWEHGLLSGEEFDEERLRIAVEALRSTNDGEIVLHKRTKDHRVIGLDKRTGKMRWTCPLASGRNAVVLRNSESSPPTVLLQHTGYSMSAHQPVSFNSPTLRVASSPERTLQRSPDIRHAHYLPWAGMEARDLMRTLPNAIAWGLFNATALLIIPGIFLARVVWKRQWSMKTLFLLPVVASIFLLNVIISRELPISSKFTVAFMILPFVIFFARQVFLLKNRRWFWVGFWVFMAALCCIPIVLLYWTQRPAWMGREGDYLVFDYWYVGLLFGSWGAGIIIAIQLGFAWLGEQWKARMNRGAKNVF